MLICELCEEAPAKYRCNTCKRYVCEKHYDPRKKRCIACTDSVCDICSNHLSIGRCYICGRKICMVCSIDVDGIRRVCVYCLIKFHTS